MPAAVAVIQNVIPAQAGMTSQKNNGAQ